ncbi:MAG: hypothetical protein V4488_17100 [Pseudomonadota bacterium]
MRQYPVPGRRFSVHCAYYARQAVALLDRSERFYGLHKLGPNMESSEMLQNLLAAYDKLFA